MDTYFADYHVHSEFSDDSVCTMEEMIQTGIQLGLNEICFTDHVDYGIKLDWDEAEGICRMDQGQPVRNVDYERYFPALEALQKKYEGQCRIKKGLEFGVQESTVNRYQQLVDKYPLDFVLLSIHEIDNKEFWNNSLWAGYTQERMNREYYEAMYRLVQQYQGYSVLGHLDLIKRYDPWGIYPFVNNEEIIREILKTVIQNGKGIEVNTSSFYYKLPDLQPCTEILKLYKELGGTIITTGSDAHKKAYLSDHIPHVTEQLKEFGFEYICTFDKMEPIYHKIK